MVTFEKIEKTDDLEHYDITVTCFSCGKKHKVRIAAGELFLLNQGMSVSQALSNESVTIRESLISGLCPDCQKEIFGR